jgi:hypothetical protein
MPYRVVARPMSRLAAATGTRWVPVAQCVDLPTRYASCGRPSGPACRTPITAVGPAGGSLPLRSPFRMPEEYKREMRLPSSGGLSRTTQAQTKPSGVVGIDCCVAMNGLLENNCRVGNFGVARGDQPRRAHHRALDIKAPFLRLKRSGFGGVIPHIRGGIRHPPLAQERAKFTKNRVGLCDKSLARHSTSVAGATTKQPARS